MPPERQGPGLGWGILLLGLKDVVLRGFSLLPIISMLEKALSFAQGVSPSARQVGSREAKTLVQLTPTHCVVGLSKSGPSDRIPSSRQR